MNNIYKEVDKAMKNIRSNIDDLSLASKGIISSNIITMQDLTLVLHEARIQYNLKSIFPPNAFAYYFMLMEVKFAPSLVILQIPMSSEYNFHHFRFIPFPTFHENETIILKN